MYGRKIKRDTEVGRMSLNRQPLTPERRANISRSLMVMSAMANVLVMEYYSDMDADFRNPNINRFAGRILQDIKAIQYHLKNNDRANIQNMNDEFMEDFAAQLHRVIHFFIKLPLSQVKEVMDSLEQVTEEETA